MRFLFKTDYEDDIRLLPHSGYVVTYGVLLAPITFIHSNVGLVLGLKAFPAAVLGGFGSIPGAVVGGVLIGVIESMAGFYLPQGWKDVAPYIVLLVVLLLKPEGLFGLHTRKKV